MMIVGILRIVLSIPGSDSLKDKRHVVKSILDTCRNKFNVSAAEIDLLDVHRRAELAFACVSNDQQFVNKVLDKIMDTVESNPLCEVIESDMEFV